MNNSSTVMSLYALTKCRAYLIPCKAVFVGCLMSLHRVSPNSPCDEPETHLGCDTFGDWQQPLPEL